MKRFKLFFRKSLLLAMVIFAGAMLATTSCNPYAHLGGDADGDGDFDGDYGWSTNVQESANQIVFTVDFDSGLSGNTLYNSSFKVVYTFTFSNDVCTRAVSVTTFESQVYADAYYYDGNGEKSGRTITEDLTESFNGFTKAQVRDFVAEMEQVYNNN